MLERTKVLDADAGSESGWALKLATSAGIGVAFLAKSSLEDPSVEKQTTADRIGADYEAILDPQVMFNPCKDMSVTRVLVGIQGTQQICSES